MTILVLVESPGKLKKIQSFLGNDYEVMASVGHIRQLPRAGLGFDIANNYSPEFEIMSDKQDVVKRIKARAKDADKVLLMADEDREGESIAWHCAEVCKLPANKRYRATFTEITKKAITTAISNTMTNNRMIDMNLVYAQFARMVLDKLIGYKVSPLLWKEYNNYHLSCGRVQSPVVRLIVQRENEIAQFNSESYYKLDAEFWVDKKNGLKIIPTTCDENITQQLEIEQLYETCKTNPNIIWNITNITTTTSKRNPSPPFITSTLQQEASSRLGMSPDTCMKTAQKLYEAGIITYMRTDAVFIAEEAQKSIKIYVGNKWGDSYYRRIDYKSKNANSQEAHECCRPVDISRESVMGIEGMTTQHNRLYQLIWRRTIASQMAPADIETITIKISNQIVTTTGNTTTGNTINKKSKSNSRNISKNKSISQTKLDTNNTDNTDNTDNTNNTTIDNINTDKGNKIYTFIGKFEKVLFDGYLVCMNLHKSSNTKKELTGNDILNNLENINDASDIDDANDIDASGSDSDIDDNQKLLEKPLKKSSENIEKILSKLKEGSQVWIKTFTAIQKFTKPPHGRYTEAALIKKLDDLGIGRPSTYASMIKKVQEEQRQYVEKKTLLPKKVKITQLDYIFPDVINISQRDMKTEGDKNKLFPTSLGIMINEYLENNFMDIINYEFTATVENLLDEIAQGTKIWYNVVDSVYIKLNPIIDQLSRAITTRKQIANTNSDNSNSANTETTPDTPNKRLLGNHPDSGNPVYALKSRKGFLICESNPDKTQSRFANFTGNFDNMTLEKALKLLIYPRALGMFKDNEIIIKKAKNIYISWNGTNYSIENYFKIHKDKCDFEPDNITYENALEIIKYYLEMNNTRAAMASQDRILNDDIVIKMGPFGPYIKYQNSINIALSKKLKENWKTITLDECLPIIEKGKNKKAKQTTSKDKKESKQVKEPKEPKQVKETKEPKQVKTTKEPKQVKQVRKPKQKQIMLEL